MNSMENTMPINCYHCNQPCDETVVWDDKTFCCQGCKSVYQLLSDKDLCQYYDLNQSPGSSFQGNTAKHLEARVNTFTRSSKPIVDPSEDSYVANALRLALFWVFKNQIVKTNSKIISSLKSTSLQ